MSTQGANDGQVLRKCVGACRRKPPCSKHLPAIKNWRCKLPSTHSFGQRRTHSILAYPPNVYDTFPDRVDEITARVVAFSYGDWFLDLPRLSYRSYMYFERFAFPESNSKFSPENRPKLPQKGNFIFQWRAFSLRYIPRFHLTSRFTDSCYPEFPDVWCLWNISEFMEGIV